MRVMEWEKGDVAFREQEVRETTWSVDDYEGERFITIRTYGPNGGGAKQIIQFDRKRAEELVDILTREFGLLSAGA